MVTTSNVAPDDLYRDGLQRARFLPAIEALKCHTTIVAVGGEEDYRLRALERAEIYHHPLDAAAVGRSEHPYRGPAAATSAKSENFAIAVKPWLRPRRSFLKSSAKPIPPKATVTASANQT